MRPPAKCGVRAGSFMRGPAAWALYAAGCLACWVFDGANRALDGLGALPRGKEGDYDYGRWGPRVSWRLYRAYNGLMSARGK